MPSLYEEWKSLRNQLGKMDVNDSLGVIRAYSVRTGMRNIREMPSDIEVHAWIDRENVFLPWELEALAREVIVCCDRTSIPTQTMRRANQLAQVLTKQKDVERYIETTYLNQQNIMHDFSVRLAHKQFKWHADRPNHAHMIRWSKIFMHPKVVPFITARTGLEPKKLFTIGAGLFGHYLSTYGMYYPLDTISLTGITEDDYAKFMGFFALPLGEMRKLLLTPDARPMNENFFYAFNPMTKYPLLFTDLGGRPAHVCPLPTLLYWRITSGLYYDLYQEVGFDNAFGEANEAYIGEVLRKEYAGTLINVYPGEPNTTTSPHRCDWLADQIDETLIVECKTKRLRLNAKISLLDHTELDAELSKLADAVRQAYQSLEAYRNSLYQNPTFTLPADKKAYIAVTTLEKWYLMGPQISRLDELVRQKIIEAGLDEAIVDESPYIVLSNDDMEDFTYLSKSHSFGELIQPYVNTRLTSGWEYGVFMNDTFKEELGEYVYVFDDELQDSYTVPIDESKRSKSRKKKHDL